MYGVAWCNGLFQPSAGDRSAGEIDEACRPVICRGLVWPRSGCRVFRRPDMAEAGVGRGRPGKTRP